MKQRSKLTKIVAIAGIVLSFLLGYSMAELKYENQVDTVEVITNESTSMEQTSEEPIYHHVGLFQEGLAYANKEQFGKYGYIDRQGKVVIDFQFVSADVFQEGLARVAIEEEEWKYGYINKKGEMVIEPQYDWGSNFYNGKAQVRKNFHEYIIDTKGNILKELKD